MPSLLERARRVRRRNNNEVSAPAPVAEQDPPPAVVVADQSDLAVPDPVAAPATPEQRPGDGAATPGTARTRISGVWVASVVGVVGLVFLLIFILQNPTPSDVYFLGAAGTLPMGLAMLFAAAAGALLIAAFGAARVLQLRRAVHRRHR
jgi:uncharacterized integral membrane protein